MSCCVLGFHFPYACGFHTCALSPRPELAVAHRMICIVARVTDDNAYMVKLHLCHVSGGNMHELQEHEGMRYQSKEMSKRRRFSRSSEVEPWHGDRPSVP